MLIIELIKQKELPIKIIESLKENFKINTIEEVVKYLKMLYKHLILFKMF